MDLAVLRDSLHELAPGLIRRGSALENAPRDGAQQGNALAFTPAPTGHRALDQALLLGGLPAGRLSEIAGAPSSGKTALALSLLAEQTRAGKLVAFVDGSGQFYPPAAAAMGVDLERLLLVQPGQASTAHSGGRRNHVAPLTRAAELIARSRAFSMVAIDVPGPLRIDRVPARRLRTAAQATGTTIIALCRAPGSVEGASARIETRAQCRSCKSGGRRATRVDIRKGGTAPCVQIELGSTSHRFDHLPPRDVAPVLVRALPGEER
jgi:protein ImuA